jgi:hypothetical protein
MPKGKPSAFQLPSHCALTVAAFPNREISGRKLCLLDKFLLYSALCPSRRTIVKDAVRPPAARGASVEHDWRAWLPAEQELVFRNNVKALESNYIMFSISLNEALELRQDRRLGKSLEAVHVSSELCLLLTAPLGGLLRALNEHAKHYGTIPNAAPLNPANFQGHKSQKSARMSSLLSHVLLSHRLQFLSKVSTLGEMVEDLGADYCHSAADLFDGTSVNPRRTWAAVDADHYDINTCLREAIVLLKSFLLVLPADQLDAFQQSILDQARAHAAHAPAGAHAIRHRRISSSAAQ